MRLPLSLSLLRGCARFAVKVARKSHRKRTHSYARTERRDKKERDTVGRREKEIAGAQMEVQAGCALGIPARKTRGGRTSKRTDGVGTEKFDHLSPPRSSLPRLVATWPAVTPFPAASDAAALARSRPSRSSTALDPKRNALPSPETRSRIGRTFILPKDSDRNDKRQTDAIDT